MTAGMSKSARKTVAFVANTSWYLWNFRSALITEFIDQGCRVLAIAPRDAYSQKLAHMGCQLRQLTIVSRSIQPMENTMLFIDFFRTYRRVRPDVLLQFTVKPNIYGSVAARMLNIPVICTVTGLGTLFVTRSWLTCLGSVLYRIALRSAAKVFFQNKEDLKMFLKKGLVSSSRTEQVPGSGVDLLYFKPRDDQTTLKTKREFVFLLFSRMIGQKGINEYVTAARALRVRGLNVACWLLGETDADNPSAISREQLAIWDKERSIRYLGSTDDVRDYVAKADCIVLPSYREGMPRSMLEAASMAKPIITTDTTGCRDTVEHGVTGFLCTPQDAEDLSQKMVEMVMLPAATRKRMGEAGREKMKREFDQKLVVQRYVDAVRGILYTDEKRNRCVTT